jgi:hypothetical protein
MKMQGKLPTGFTAQLPPYEIIRYPADNIDNCRVQVRRTSEDGINWSKEQIVLAPDPMDPPDTQFHELTVFPYSNKGLLGMVLVEHCNEQTATQYFAASKKGTKWWRPSRRRPCVPLAPLGDDGGGCNYAMRMLIEQGNQMHLYYAALSNQQNTLYGTQSGGHPFSGSINRMTWQTGRFFAAVTSRGGKSTGELLTPLQDNLKGKTLIINALTLPGGKIEVELTDQNGKPIPGYTRADCLPLQGDHTNVTFRWKTNKTSPPINKASTRVYFTKARLYGFEWR